MRPRRESGRKVLSQERSGRRDLVPFPEIGGGRRVLGDASVRRRHLVGRARNVGMLGDAGTGRGSPSVQKTLIYVHPVSTSLREPPIHSPWRARRTQFKTGSSKVPGTRSMAKEIVSKVIRTFHDTAFTSISVTQQDPCVDYVPEGEGWCSGGRLLHLLELAVRLGRHRLNRQESGEGERGKGQWANRETRSVLYPLWLPEDPQQLFAHTDQSGIPLTISVLLSSSILIS